jgi:protein SCO1
MRQLVKENFRKIIGTVLLALCVCVAGCEKPRPVAAKSYPVRGVVKEVNPTKKSVTVKHEEIPGYMMAMTMPFDVKNTNELRGLQPGDRITFKLLVTEKDGWIEHIVKLGASPDEMPSRSNVEAVKAIAPLDPGQPLPAFHLTNELGQAVSLSDLKGKAFAMTFIFTRCPFPTFCPRMTSNFADVAKKMSERRDAPQNWTLLSISFDPQNDTPETLLKYAEAQHYNPAHWHFLTGTDAQITQLCEVFDEKFWHDGTSISHNLRTAVIDANGRVQKVFEGNEWSPDDLVSELIKACKPAR